MRIAEIAERSGVAPSRIRFYEARGLLPVPRRRDNGYRDYPPSMIATLQFIEDAKALGFLLREIGSVISPSGETEAAASVILPALERKLADLEAHIAASRTLRSRLLGLIAKQRACL